MRWGGIRDRDEDLREPGAGLRRAGARLGAVLAPGDRLEMSLETLKSERSLPAASGDPGRGSQGAGAPSSGKVDRVVEVFRKGVRARILFGALSAALCGYFLWGAFTSQQGLLAYLQMRKTLERLREENLAHLRRNGQLEKEIYLLRNSPAYLEKVAREEFGYLREGEVLFWFSHPGQEPDLGPPSSGSVASESAPPRPPGAF